MKSPVITLAELNTVYKDLIDRINVASVYNFKDEITITQMMNTNTKSDVAIGDIYEIHNILSENDIDIANTLNLQEHDNIACKKALTKGTKLSLNPDENNYWGNYWTEIGSYMQLADDKHNGFVSISTQTFSGTKTFLDDVIVGKTLTVNGSNPNTGNVTTSILKITGGESSVNTLTATTLKVNDTATVQNIEGPNTTINVIKGGTTTVNTIDGIGPDGNKDYADFKVNGIVTCKNFDLSSSDLTLNAATTVNSIQHKSCILKPSGDVYCANFIATGRNITANQVDSTIKQIDNSDAVLKASGIVSCVNFDASGKSITAKTIDSIISNIDNTDGVLNVSGSIKCSTLDATGQTIEAKKATSKIKNISSDTATLSDVTSVKCGTLDLGTHQLTVNDTTTFSKISTSTSTSPSLYMSGTLTCGDVTLQGSDTDKPYMPLTVNSGTTFSSISKISDKSNLNLKVFDTITCGDFNNGSYSITTNNSLTFSSIDNTDITGNPSTTSKLKSTGTISCKDFNLSSSSITSSMSSGITFSSISNASKLSASGEIKCINFDLSNSNISSNTANQSITFSSITTGSNSTLNSTGKISCIDFSNTSGTITTSNDSISFSNITGSGTLNVSGTLYCGKLYASSGSGTVQVPTVNLGDGTNTIPITLNTSKSGTNTNQKYWSNCVVIGDTNISDPDSKDRGDLIVNGHIFAKKVHNAVWNDLVDCIPVDDDIQLEYGYCYCFDGENYHKSNKHCDPQFIGIHSDTSGMRMGERPCKTLDVAISGFVLAYVDRYESGTPLVCGKNGRLEKATVFDKIFKPYRIIATYWKDENEEKYGPEFSKIKVNGRNWVKIK